jgi:putative endonuclease
MSYEYYVYIVTNFTNTTLYIGVTNNLKRRIAEHKSGLVEGFTKKYKLTKLVYFERFTDVRYAIQREKQLKAGSRKKKLELINSINSEWKDIFDEL